MNTTINYDRLVKEAIDHGMDIPTYIEYLKAISENERIREAQKATPINRKSSSPAAVIVIVILVVTLLSAIAYIILSPKPEGTASVETTTTPATHSETKAPLYSRPANGLIMKGLNASDKQALLEVSVGSGNDYYILLHYTAGFDVSFGRGCHNFAFYARAGETVSINVPVGTAKIYYATGDIWYSKIDLFGEDTRRYASDDVFDFSNYDYEVTLYPVSDGNMETDEVYSFPE